MSIFPLDPRYSRAILSAEELGCTEEVITIVSMLSGDTILVTPASKKEEAITSRKHFISSEGDHITYLKIFRAYKQASNATEFCTRYFVHQRHMKFAIEGNEIRNMDIRFEILRFPPRISDPLIRIYIHYSEKTTNGSVYSTS